MPQPLLPVRHGPVGKAEVKICCHELKENRPHYLVYVQIVGNPNRLLVIAGTLISGIVYKLPDPRVRRRACMRLLCHEVKQRCRPNSKLMAFNIFPDILEKCICCDASPFKRQKKLFFGHKGLGAIHTPRLFNAFKKVV